MCLIYPSVRVVCRLNSGYCLMFIHCFIFMDSTRLNFQNEDWITETTIRRKTRSWNVNLNASCRQWHKGLASRYPGRTPGFNSWLMNISLWNPWSLLLCYEDLLLELLASTVEIWGSLDCQPYIYFLVILSYFIVGFNLRSPHTRNNIDLPWYIIYYFSPLVKKKHILRRAVAGTYKMLSSMRYCSIHNVSTNGFYVWSVLLVCLSW